MRLYSAALEHQAGLAFDSLAEPYDELFTDSLIGRAQRDTVWNVASRTFQPGQHILELNCGTGEDALFFSRLGISVFACDASQNMITVAKRRHSLEAPMSHVGFAVLPSEEIAIAGLFGPFDGVFSNFSGLNCVSDIADVARQLATIIRPGGSALLCLSTRLCLWEVIWFVLRGELRKSFRRWRGCTVATVGGVSVKVHYPSIGRLRKLLSPYFHLRTRIGVGIMVPPSYVEPLAQKYPELLSRLQAVDSVICRWPAFRSVGDHVLLVLERTSL